MEIQLEFRRRIPNADLFAILIGGMDFSNFFLVLNGTGPYATLKEATDAGAVVARGG